MAQISTWKLCLAGMAFIAAGINPWSPAARSSGMRQQLLHARSGRCIHSPDLAA